MRFLYQTLKQIAVAWLLRQLWDHARNRHRAITVTTPNRELDLGNYPSARDPWIVELCWTPDQNYGAVSVWPTRTPVHAMWGLLAAGEPVAVVATEFGCTVTEVRVLDELRREMNPLVEVGEDDASSCFVTPPVPPRVARTSPPGSCVPRSAH